MSINLKKIFSVYLILLFVVSQAAIAGNCPCQTNCCQPQQQCCPTQQPCCENSCCPAQTPCCGQSYCQTPCSENPCCQTQQPCCGQPCCGNPCCQNQGCSDSCGCQSNCDCCCDPCNSCACARIEHLCTNKNTPVDTVKICGCQAFVLQNVVIETTLGQKVFSKRLCPGDTISFNLPNGLWTCEGRKLIPACSQIVARVECVIPPKVFNKNAKVGLNFCYILLPDGRSYPICARIFNSEGMLKETKLMAAGKVALWTVGLFGVGTGLAAAFGAHTRHAGQAALTIGMPVGFGVGLLTGLISPGLHYRGKCGEKVLIQLTDCLRLDLS